MKGIFTLAFDRAMPLTRRTGLGVLCCEGPGVGLGREEKEGGGGEGSGSEGEGGRK